MSAAPGDAAGELTITGTVQRQAWLDRETPPVEKVATDIWSIPIPMPMNPLRYISVYVLAVPDGVVTVDAGWGSDDAWAAFQAGLGEIGASTVDVRGVLVTHMHFDHVGLAGRIREASGAWIGMHAADIAVLREGVDRARVQSRDEEIAFLRGLGASEEEAATAVGPMEWWSSLPMPLVPDREIGDGERLDLPGWQLRAVHTPGHTPGHLTFLEERTRTLFAGDHILPRISPNISLATYNADDPLGDFLASLDKVRPLPADHVYPAHEWRFDGLAARVDQLREHHRARCDEVIDTLRRHPGSTPWDIAAELTWSRPWSAYDGRMRIAAVTETASHVVYLARRGMLISTPPDDAAGPPTYRVP